MQLLEEVRKVGLPSEVLSRLGFLLHVSELFFTIATPGSGGGIKEQSEITTGFE